ncbi:flagellar hook protein FlgE [Thiomicrospira sp. R3]|uniref:flagellar hook protein FlgE n=1 Tax=Thiomicrospira sp. R3 TaxID=3035472 RepID=UPI00259BCB98|nr:flagellar hook protein FlgE [Thiomicrospira sp. R3]WFE67889.1 flagellar hook protein FlgE [Thiomicrospira sp. R3]
MSAYDLNALSGINAMSQGLSVVSNNLANAQTMGFKSSRAEFADMFSGAQTTPGNGVRVNSITQDFSQGTIASTGRELDMAIDGDGFFILEDKSGKYSNIYTRNGSFKLDKDGFITDQTGNNLLGFNLNQVLSTESKPVFDTALNPINLADLNRTPKATDQMNYNINLDGEALINEDKLFLPDLGTVNNSVGGNSVPASDTTSTLPNIQKLTNPAQAYGGFPDFTYPMTIHDSLGGAHKLSSNFYMRDVVTSANSDVGLDPATGNYITDGTGVGVKYTSWLVQYSVERFNDGTGQWETSGFREAVPADGTASGDTGLVYELRFDTNGRLIDARQPNVDPLATGATSAITGQDNPNEPLVFADWSSVGTQPKMQWVINNPIIGANDPLGNPQAITVGIDVNFADMTMFAGDNLLRGVTQNGYKIGDLVGLTTNREGVIEARYSNGRSIPVAQLALGNFNDLNALEKLGGQMYAESFGSGPVQISKAGSGVVGAIQAGSLEYSNVDTAGELVKMIQLQRTYQASAQVISTSQELTRTILNL